MDLESLPTFPKSVDGLRKAGTEEQPFDVKDIFNTSLESEALKETLYRQAKTQVCDWSLSAHERKGILMMWSIEKMSTAKTGLFERSQKFLPHWQME